MSVYTMDDWRRARTFDADPGQEVTAEVYEEMHNVVPAKPMTKEKAQEAMDLYRIPVHAGFMMGEPTATNDSGEALYRAFGMNDYGRGAKYYYLGLATAFKPLHGAYYYFDCMNAFVNDGLFRVSEFRDEAEAIRTAADYEATLIKYEYDHGDEISRKVIYQPMFL